jgi:negative regulator of genetic competence, sporulation and motility
MNNTLFDDYENEWQKEWKDMPEFISENKKPYQQIIVSFRDFNDVKEFAKILGLNVSPKTDALWFPLKEKESGFYYKNDNWGKDEK